MKNNRLWQNLRSLILRNPYRQHFTSQHRTTLSQQVSAAEIGHRGEIRLVVETQLPITLALNNVTARQRAISWFSDLRIWDTEENSGILLYLLLSERKIEIVADRGITKLVEQAEWDRICTQLQSQLSADHIHDGLHLALQDLGNLLRHHYQIQDPDTNPDELSNELIFIP